MLNKQLKNMKKNPKKPKKTFFRFGREAPQNFRMNMFEVGTAGWGWVIFTFLKPH